MTTNYVSAHKSLIVDNWPLGLKRLGQCTFTIESNNRGERCARVTTGKPKTTTYGPMCRILLADDGKTYVATTTIYGFISILRGTMDTTHESIYNTDSHYPHLLELMQNAE